MSGPDVFYANFALYNNGDGNYRGELQNTYQTPVLYNPKEYRASIVRFTVDANWPLFVPTIPNPAFPQRTNISISFSYNGNFFQQFVELSVDEAKNGVFDFGLFLEDLNTASALAFAAMKAAFPAAPGVFPPYFALDARAGLIDMYVETGWLDDLITPNFIWFNTYLQDLLNLPATRRFNPPQQFGADFRIAVKNYATLLPAAGSRVGFPYALSARAGIFLRISQEWVQLSEFSDIFTIQFTSNMLPFIPESVPVTPNTSQGAMIQTNYEPIITDFVITRADAKPRDNSFVYLPTAQFRYFELTSDTPLRVIDLRANYTRYNGTVSPLVLSPEGNFTMKMMFEKKK